MKTIQSIIQGNQDCFFELQVYVAVADIEACASGCFDMDGICENDTILVIEGNIEDGVVSISDTFVVDDNGNREDTGDDDSSHNVAIDLINKGCYYEIYTS